MTGILDGLVLVVVGVTVVVADGVALGVVVAVALGLAVGVGEGADVGGPFEGSDVVGKVASTAWTSLILGVAENLVMVTTVTVVAFPVPDRGFSTRSSNVTESCVPYFACRASWAAFCTTVSMRVFKRTQMF